MGCGLKSFMLIRRCHQLRSGFLANGHLPREICQSRVLANGKDKNEVNLGAVHKSPGMYLMLSKNQKISARRSSDEGCGISHRLKWDHLSPNDVVRIAQYVREEEERLEGNYREELSLG